MSDPPHRPRDPIPTHTSMVAGYEGASREETRGSCTKKQLGIVVSYSSNEARFLPALARELPRCGALDVVFAVGTHLFDMEPEPEPMVPGRVVRYNVRQDAREVPRHYHNLARESGVAALAPGVDWVIFIDADEVPEGDRVREWFNATELHSGTAYKIACHWYFLHPVLRAKEVEDSILLVPRSRLSQEALRDPRERDGIVAALPVCERMVSASEPLFHHYSWVRDRKGLLRKVRTWGHRNDRLDWEQCIDDALNATSIENLTENGVAGDFLDFVHGYKYDIAPDFLQSE